jgi:1,2-dihydroxy-3-keto-5-methylthiopentene dioxygenase
MNAEQDMAIVSIPDKNTVLTEEAEVASYLAGIDIEYDAWPLHELSEDADNDTILRTYATEIEEAKQKGRYINVDVVNVDSLTPGLDEMLARFNREHWHDEDEVRFIVAGRGLFHIHPKDGDVVAIEVGPGDMIRVPRGTHHWFNLCQSNEIKAIRFFQDKSGWTPNYTGNAVAEKYEPVCFGSSYIPVYAEKPL